MTPQQVQAFYEELDTLKTEVRQVPEMGGEYFKEKLYEVRAKGDRLIDMMTRVHHDLGLVEQAVRGLQASVRLIKASPEHVAELEPAKRELEERENERDMLGYLLEALKLHRLNNRACNDDIRTLIRDVNAQRARGEIAPPKGIRESVPFTGVPVGASEEDITAFLEAPRGRT